MLFTLLKIIFNKEDNISVIDFRCHGLDDLIETVRQETAYTITKHLLELNGLCPDCQKGRAA